MLSQFAVYKSTWIHACFYIMCCFPPCRREVSVVRAARKQRHLSDGLVLRIFCICSSFPLSFIHRHRHPHTHTPTRIRRERERNRERVFIKVFPGMRFLYIQIINCIVLCYSSRTVLV